MLIFLNDQYFWIYATISLFFTILGIYGLYNSNLLYKIPIILIWVISQFLILITCYHNIINIYPSKCIININNDCPEKFNYPVWIYLHITYLYLLILSTVWCYQHDNCSNEYIYIVGILVLIGTILIPFLSNNINSRSMLSLAFLNIIIWFILIWITLKT